MQWYGDIRKVTKKTFIKQATAVMKRKGGKAFIQFKRDLRLN